MACEKKHYSSTWNGNDYDFLKCHNSHEIIRY